MTGPLRRLIDFVAGWRSLPPYELVSYTLMFASVPMLASGTRRFDGTLLLRVIAPTVLSLYAGFFAALIVNDITDADIDASAHPDRPIPAGRVSKRTFVIASAIFALLCFGFAAAVSAWCLLVTVGTFAFALVHNKYLKRGLRIPGYSELFGSTQWLAVGVFGYVAVWSRAPVERSLEVSLPLLGTLSTSQDELLNMLLLAAFIYSVDTWHDIPEGILDIEGDRKAGVTTFALSFGEKTAARLSFAMFLLSGLVGVALFLRTSLSPLFLVGFLALYLSTARYPWRMVRSVGGPAMRAACSDAGRKGFDYFLFCFDLIFLDLLVQHLLKR